MAATIIARISKAEADGIYSGFLCHIDFLEILSKRGSFGGGFFLCGLFRLFSCGNFLHIGQVLEELEAIVRLTDEVKLGDELGGLFVLGGVVLFEQGLRDEVDVLGQEVVQITSDVQSGGRLIGAL